MGSIQNIHFGDTPEFRAEAERIAVQHAMGLSKIIEAAANLDETGRQYWLQKYDAAEEAWNNAFRLYKESRNMLKSAAESYIALEPQHEKSSKVELVKLFGLDKAGGDIKANYSKIVVSIEGVIDWITHILTVEHVGPDALRRKELKPIYAAISETGRELELAACQNLALLVETSRATHRISDLVEAMRTMDRKAMAAGIPAA